MPKCLINSVRDYKCGTFNQGSFVYDPFVMTTRSGLSINTIPRGSSSTVGHRLPSPPELIKDTVYQTKKRETTTKKRPLSYLSFVTRFHLSQRIPELDTETPTSSKDFSDWKNELFRLDETRSTELSDVESDSDYEVCIGSVDDSPCTFSQSSDELTEVDADDENEPEAKRELANSSSESEIDVVGNNSNSQLKINISSNSQIKVEPISETQLQDGQTLTKYSVLDSVSYLQADKLVCTTLGPKIAFSLVNGYRSSGSGSQCRINAATTGTQKKIMTLAEASSLFFVKPNILSGHDRNSGEIERLDEREKYCKNTIQVCPHCDKEFFLFSALQSHIRRHGKHENRCDECGKMFSRSWLLKGHLRTHTGERPFNCPDEECDRAFADKSNLRSHMLIHSTKNKTHVCARCGRGFAQKRYLHKHMLEVCRVVRA